MSVFVDRSALYALLDRDDANHEQARAVWLELRRRREPLLTHNYVLVETVALAQRRLGVEAVRALRDGLLPLVHSVWVEQELHQRALAATIASRLRNVSLVDWISFEVTRLRGCRAAFAFDDDFAEEGIEVVGSPNRRRRRLR
jgi:predicted nucleic acid-binding protein